MNDHPNDLFQAAQTALDAGDLATALMLATKLRDRVGAHFAILHLLASIFRKQGEFGNALVVLHEAIKTPKGCDDPVLAMNRASLLERLGQTRAALDEGRRAAALADADWAIHLAHINLVRRLEGDNAAKALFERLIANNPNDPTLHHYFALFLRAVEDLDAAEKAIDRTLALNPESSNAMQLRAEICQDAGIASLAAFEIVERAKPDNRSVAAGVATALLREHGAAAALEYLEQRLAAWPDWNTGREILVKLAWQSGDAERALSSLSQRAIAVPDDTVNAAAYVQFVAATQGPAAALSLAQQLFHGSDLADHQDILGALASEAGDIAQADGYFDRLATDETKRDRTVEHLRHTIRAGRIDAAKRRAEALALDHNRVDAWPYCWSLWRATNDPRLDWLEAGGCLWQEVALPGFAELNGPLSEHLRALHRGFSVHPYEQSSRGGTQTDGPLFARTAPEIRHLRSMVRGAVGDYVSRLPPIDPSHPFLRAPRHNFEFSGSWSIRLSDGGFHQPHFHSHGWLSSALYVSLPASIAKSDSPRRDGWLILGQPPADLKLDLPPLASIEPREGRLVLFPSILWHGTEPFVAGERMTVAFDIIPCPY